MATRQTSSASGRRILERRRKRYAYECWRRAIKRSTSFTILAGVQRFAADPNLPPIQFIPHPSSWLNADQWNDEPLPQRNVGKETGVEKLLDIAHRAKLAEESAVRNRLFGELEA